MTDDPAHSKDLPATAEVESVAAEEAPATPPFERCPRCRKSLRGQRASGKCPRCDLKYDERCLLVRVGNRIRPAVLMVLAIAAWGCVAPFAFTKVYERFAAPVPGPWAVLWLAVLFGIVPVLHQLKYTVRNFFRGCCIAATTDELIVRVPHQRCACIPWRYLAQTNVQERSYRRGWNLILEFRDIEGSIIYGKGLTRIFSTVEEAKLCVAEIRRRIALWTASPERRQVHPQTQGSVDADAADEPPFERCPRCRFRLTGLPADHYCPECGLRYDSSCKLYGFPMERGLKYTMPIVFTLYAVMAVWCCFGYATDPAEFRKVMLFLVILLPFLALATVTTQRDLERWSEYGVAVTADALVFRNPGLLLPTAVYTWEQIIRADMSRAAIYGCSVVALKVRGRREKIRVGRGFTTLEDAERFLLHVRGRMAWAAAAREAEDDRSMQVVTTEDRGQAVDTDPGNRRP
jgi:hypothetical protein